MSQTADITLSSHPAHHTVGKLFKAWDGNIYFCESHDPSGYWMMPTDGSAEWRNVSERAIGRTFHEVYEIEPGRFFCRFGGVTLPWVQS